MKPKILSGSFLDLEPGAYDGTNRSGIVPLGDMVVILPDKVPERTRGGLYLSEETKSTQSLAAETGIMIEAGEGAFVWTKDRMRELIGRKPVPGDRVFYARYSGQQVVGADGQTYRYMDDKCIGAIAEGDAAPAEKDTAKKAPAEAPGA